MRKRVLFSAIPIILLFVCASFCFAQMKEEKEEQDVRTQIIERQKAKDAFDIQAALRYGYDSNVNLSGERKGDSFQEALLSIRSRHPLLSGIEMECNYMLDVKNYSEITDASNVINRAVVELNKHLSLFKIGVGYDVSYLAYPYYEEGDFVFHKGFWYVGNDLTSKLYHQLKLYYGIKDYLDGKTLSETSLAVDPAKDRLDRRQGAEYLIKFFYNKKLSVHLMGSYAMNDSNARYLDYYDYTSPGVSCGFGYRLSSALHLVADYSYRRKNYKGRTVTNSNFSYKQKDTIYAANVGFLYLLGKQSSLSFNYSYRETSSNDSLSEYSENEITCGWRYQF